MAYSLETSSVKTIVPGAEVSGFADVVARQKISTLSGEVPKLSAGEGIAISNVNGKTVITNNISAGENISLVYDMETNTYRIDGQDAGHTYTGDEPIYVNNETNHIGITGESLSAGPNIDIFPSGGYVVISANGGGEGAIYTGVSPIDVNNTTHQISAKGVSFGVQSPLFFVQDDNEAVIIGCSAGGTGGDPEVENVVHTYSAEGTWLTAHQDISNLMPKSESSNFYPMTGNPSGFLTAHQSLDNYATTAQLNTASSTLTGEVDYLSGAIVNVSADALELSAGDGITLTTSDSKIRIDCTATGGTTYTGDAQGALDEVYANSGVWLTAHQDISNLLPKSESANYYPMTGNPSGFLTTHQSLSNYVSKSDTSVAIGWQNKATDSFAQGEKCSATSWSFAQGSNNSAGFNSFAQGVYNSATDYYSFAQGGYNKATGMYSVAQGYYNSAASQSFAQGFRNSAYDTSLAQGASNTAYNESIAQGRNNYATNKSQAFGNNTKATNNGMAIGTYNNITTGAFVIGNGTWNNKSDAFIIFHDGSVSAAGKISANGVELGAGGSVTGEFVPQSAFDELKQSYDALSSLFATYSGQWLLPNEGEE